MANLIQIKRGTKATLPTLADGEPGWCTDTHEVYIGSGAANYGLLRNNVSATDKVLGRVTAGAGVVEEIACTAAGRALLDDADAAAQRTTLGVGTGDGPTFDHLHLTSGQIGFPATQVPSADANTLDDYEEGTWTPTITFGGASVGITYGPTVASYTKIGKRIFINGVITLTSKGTSVGDAYISNLPFVNENVDAAYTAILLGYFSTITFANQCFLYMDKNVSFIRFYQTTEAGVATPLANVNFANNSTFNFSGSYISN